MTQTKTITKTSPRAITTAQLVRAVNRWRDSLNPLRGLVISRLVDLFDAAERGEYADLQWTYRKIEKRYAILRSLIARRRAALQKLDWNIKISDVIPDGLESLAQEQQAMLRARYDAIGNLGEAIAFLERAEFRGYAHLQKHRRADGLVTELHWLPQWNWVRDGNSGDWVWNPEAKQTTASSLPNDNRIGVGLNRDDFIIRETDLPINEIAAISFVNSSMAKKDWAAFIEIFGLPNCIIIMPPMIPSGKEDDYEDSAQRVAEGGSGAIPHGSDAKFPSAAVRASAPFKEFLDYEEKDVVLAGTGGKLTMLNEATGIGGSQAGVHQDAFDDLANAEAMDISEVLQKQFDAQELAAEFPGRPVLAYFELAKVQQADPNQLVDQVTKLGAQFVLNADEVSEKTGWKLAEKTAPAPATPLLLPAPDDTETSWPNRTQDQEPDRQAVYEAIARDLQPLRKRIERILQIEDPEILKTKLESLRGELPSLLRDLNADPDSARALTQRLEQAYQTGATAQDAT